MQRGAMNSMRALSFFLSTKFFFDISISGGYIGEKEVSTVTTSYLEHYASIFVFRSKKFIFNISISGGRTGERDASTANFVVARKV